MAEAVLHRMHSPLVTGLGTAAWSSWGYGPRAPGGNLFRPGTKSWSHRLNFIGLSARRCQCSQAKTLSNALEERAERACDPISRQHYKEMAAHYRALSVEHKEIKPEQESAH